MKALFVLAVSLFTLQAHAGPTIFSGKYEAIGKRCDMNYLDAADRIYISVSKSSTDVSEKSLYIKAYGDDAGMEEIRLGNGSEENENASKFLVSWETTMPSAKKLVSTTKWQDLPSKQVTGTETHTLEKLADGSVVYSTTSAHGYPTTTLSSERCVLKKATR